MTRFALVSILVGLFAAPVWAADGDACATTGRTARRGWEVKCNLVCDTKTSASSSCTDFVVAEAADTYILEIAEDEGCAVGATITVTTQGISDTDTHSLTALDTGGTTSVVIAGAAAHPLTRLNFVISSPTSCTDLDVKLWSFYERRD